MKTVKSLQQSKRRQLKDMDVVLTAIEKGFLRDKKENRAQRKEIEKECDSEIAETREMGGLMGKDEAQQFLGVSRQRFSKLTARGEFRTLGSLFSYADVKKYKKGRRVGRPVNSTNRKEKK